MSHQRMLDSVKTYLARGWRPIPVFGVNAAGTCGCGAPELATAHGKVGQGIGKHPIDPDWKDRKPFEASEFPEGCNVALAMGRQVNGDWLVALDFDGEVQEESWLGPLPPTLSAITGRGFHLVFRTEAFAPLGNWRDAWFTRDKATGYRLGFNGALDIRFARGAIVAPPSAHRNGSTYQWLHQNDEVADLPTEALRKILQKRRARGLPVERKWDRKGKAP